MAITLSSVSFRLSESPARRVVVTMSVLFVLDLMGVFAFALFGGWLALRRELDLVGTLSLAFVTGPAGGITRDVLVGDLPPVALVEERHLLVPALAAHVVLAAPGASDGSRRP